MAQIKRPTRSEAETLEDFVRRYYCVTDPDGREDTERLRLAVEAVAAAEAEHHEALPNVPGVPQVRYRIDDPSQIPEAVQRFLPEAESDPRLHALSFVDPLQVANQLGIVVSPLVARVVRRGLGAAVTFDQNSLDAEGRLRGQGTMRWRPKTAQGGDH
jgi:hypothetical protein